MFLHWVGVYITVQGDIMWEGSSEVDRFCRGGIPTMVIPRYPPCSMVVRALPILVWWNEPPLHC